MAFKTKRTCKRLYIFNHAGVHTGENQIDRIVRAGRFGKSI